jgi:predicted SnoaL-like aldol condensation-catalyzing enzyme
VRVDVESIVAEGDIVAVRLTFSGTQASTGEQAVWPEMVFTRFSDGMAVESWEVIDTGRDPQQPALVAARHGTHRSASRVSCSSATPVSIID